MKAQEDAQKALQLDPYNVKALLAKAESLFASGKFELGIRIENEIFLQSFYLILALVEFEKGSRIFRGSEIGSGIEKCHQVFKMIEEKTYYINIL